MTTFSLHCGLTLRPALAALYPAAEFAGVFDGEAMTTVYSSTPGLLRAAGRGDGAAT